MYVNLVESGLRLGSLSQVCIGGGVAYMAFLGVSLIAIDFLWYLFNSKHDFKSSLNVWLIGSGMVVGGGSR